MPFQNLRVNSQFYILHKDGTPYVEVGAIAGVSNPVPDGTQPVMFGQPMKMVVDITVKVGEQTVTFQKIPAGADIADANFPGGGNMVISGSRESMNSEVAAHEEQVRGDTQEHRPPPCHSGRLRQDDGDPESRVCRKTETGGGKQGSQGGDIRAEGHDGRTA